MSRLDLSASEIGFKDDPEERLVGDVAAAESFVEKHGDRVRFDHRRSRWLVWDRHRWAPDVDGAIYRLFVAHARSEQHRAVDLPSRPAKERVLKYWTKFEHRGAAENALAFVRVLKPVADSGERWDLDMWLLGSPNGVVDLRTGTLRPGRPDDGITMSVAVPFDPDARCPRWEQFMAEVFPDPDVAEFVWRALGYSLTGDMREQCFFLNHGRGRNGKSTLLDTVSTLIGDYGQAAAFETFEVQRGMSIPADVAALEGRRLVKAAEPAGGPAGRWLNAGRLKDITGGEKISARHLYANPFTFRPVCKIWLSVNERPRVGDDSEGLWRRMRQVPFVRTFDDETDDRGLKDTLQAESAGILAWLVRGALAWRDNGLVAPAAVVSATAEYRLDSDQVGRFLDEACELEPDAEVGARDLYEHYQAWAHRAGLSDRETLNVTVFGRKLGERFRKARRGSGIVYFGVARAVGMYGVSPEDAGFEPAQSFL